MKSLKTSLCLSLLMIVAGCGLTPPNVIGDGTQLQTRQFQTRNYETLDKKMTMRSVIATLQDLGFTIDAADVELGTITATRLNRSIVRMTVTVTPGNGHQLAVRTNARIGQRPIEDPETYQDFFAALDRSLFLAQNRVD